MIHRAKFQNFKALRDVEIAFDSRLTVLVGPNGSGKTSVLQGIELASRTAELELPPEALFVSHPTLQEVWGGPESAELLIELSEENSSDSVRGLRLEAAKAGRQWQAGNRSSLAWWSLYGRRSDSVQTYHLGRKCPAEARPTFIPVELLRLEPKALRAVSVTEQSPPRMDSSGAGLPSVLSHLKLADDARFEQIVKEFTHLIPNVNRVRIERVRPDNRELFGEGMLFDLVAASGVRASGMSDGTLYLLGLLTLICGPHRPKLLLLDDLDHGLHPKAQMELVGVLRKLLAQFPDLQIVATSHSPYILDKLKPEEVRLVTLRDDGTSACARLEQHPQYPVWKESMSPGEFWSHAGEDWIKKLPAEQLAQ
jgi:predicted ATPase